MALPLRKKNPPCALYLIFLSHLSTFSVKVKKIERLWQLELKNYAVRDKCWQPNTSPSEVTSSKWFENVSRILSKFEEILVIFRKFVDVFLTGLKV